MNTNKSPLERMEIVQKKHVDFMMEMWYLKNISVYPLRNLGYKTPFEQAAHDIQFRTKNRVSGPDLAPSLNVTESKADRELLVASVCLVAFIILLILIC